MNEKNKKKPPTNNDNKSSGENINTFKSNSYQLKVYQDLKAFKEKYYINSNKNKIIKDDYSYDVEKIVLDDEEFYLPYNKTALFINQQRFITPYDIHDTMVHFVSDDYYWKSKKGQTLTNEIDGLKRNCQIYIDDFDNKTINEYCHCIPFQ